tara:strand:- start:290 stop:439 length:150 start_codon:yes stop_codon:yes gene_type:complete
MLKWHKKLLKYWKEKLGLSNDALMWISYSKGVLFGLLIYHFLIHNYFLE